MENSRLPIEICERVIDECFDLGNFYKHKTLQACALTCSVWLPRSQYNLYREVYLHDSGQTSKRAAWVVESLKTKPELAAHVRVFDIKLMRTYVPLAQVVDLVLVGCQRLKVDVEWISFPPRYVHNCLVPLLTNLVSVTELQFVARSAASAREFFYVIWAMPQLLSCKLYGFYDSKTSTALLANLGKTALKIQSKLSLKTLALGVSLQHQN